MTWSIRSRIDGNRWLTSDGDLQFDCDRETRVRLGDLRTLRFPLTPVGPDLNGVLTPSDLLAAAIWAIPAPIVDGDPPQGVAPPRTPPGTVS